MQTHGRGAPLQARDSHGSKAAASTVYSWDDPVLEDIIPADLLAQARVSARQHSQV